MTVKKVYIQVGDDGMPMAPCGYALWEGARFLDLSPEAFRWQDMPKLPLSRETLVHGWVRTVQDALRQVGAQVPPPLDYPEELSPFLGREVRLTTLGEVHKTFIENESPLFIKPVAHKMFTGHTLERFSDLAETTNIDPSTPIWASGVVNFASEYRCFVHAGSLIGVQRYCGDNWILPDKKVVIQMIRAYQNRPIAYGLDVGVTAQGETLLVEVNDWHSLGNYALGSLPYTDATIDRWEEMVSLSVDTNPPRG